MEINKPQIKVDTLNRNGSDGRILILTDLDLNDSVNQIKLIVLRIQERFQSADTKIKLIHRAPVIFHIINGEEVFRFTISFPTSLLHVQNDLITGIEKVGYLP